MIIRVFNYMLCRLRVNKLAKKGRKVRIMKPQSMTYKNIFCGNDVYIGPGALFICTNAPIKIGSYVEFGPNVTIITGNHRTDVVGKYITEVGENDKIPENDSAVVLEGNNWIGANATILKGVTVGKGAVIAACALVNKNVPPYSIVGGIPAKVLSMRFTETQIQEHEKLTAYRK